MELKKLHELEAIFYEFDFNQNDEGLKKEIIKDISGFDLIVWQGRKDILIRKFNKDSIKINCPSIHYFNYPKDSENHLIVHGEIAFKYNNRFYSIKQLLFGQKEYSIFP